MKLRSSISLRSLFLKRTTFFILASFLILVTFLSIGILRKKLQASAYTADDFVTTWNSGDDRIVKIPVYKNTNDTNGPYGPIPGLSGYNYTIDWGDGSPIETFITGSTDTTNTTPTHTYPNPNTEYQIVISGTFPGWTFNYNTNNLGGYTDNSNVAEKLTKLNQWGTGTWKRMDFMFSDCSNLEAFYTDSPNTSEVTDMSSMFSNASKFNGVVNFDTSNVTYISGMFAGATSFNQPVNFNTSNVTDMSYMFNGTSSFNQPVNFNTSNVTDMSDMFAYAYSFNQPVNFDTSNVTNMSYMFSGATSFNQPVNFDTSNVTDMSGMFSGATSFNQPLNFDTSNVTNMSYMFFGTTSFNQPVNFNTSNVTDMSYMFNGTSSFNQDLSSFDFSKITDVGGLSSFAFFSALSVENYDKLLNKWYNQLGSNGIAYTNVNMSPLKYCQAEAAREHLLKPVAEGGAGWQLTDGGKGCIDHNLPPSKASLTNRFIHENSPSGTFVGAFIVSPTIDILGDTNTISLTCGTPAPAGATGTVGVAGVDDNLFTIQDNYEDPTIPTAIPFSYTGPVTIIIPGNPTDPGYSTTPNPGSTGNPATVLLTNTNPSNLSFSTKPDLHICVRVMDSYNYFIDQPLTIHLMKVDTPSTISLEVPTTTNITANPGTFTKSTINAKVMTNNETGYSLTLRNNDNTTNMTNTNPAIVDIISNLNSTLSGINGTNSFLQSEFPTNTWGYTLDDTSTEEHASTANYHAIPTQSNPATIKTSNTATPIGADPSHPTGETTNLTLGFNISTSLPAGSYTDSLIFAAVANFNPNPTTPKNYNYLTKLIEDDLREGLPSLSFLTACQNTYTPTASATIWTRDFEFEGDKIPKMEVVMSDTGTTMTVIKTAAGVCETYGSDE